MTDEPRHADVLAAQVADFRRLGFSLRADNLKAEIARHLDATKTPAPARPSGYDPSKVDWDRPVITGPITAHGTELVNVPIHGKLSVQAEDVAIVNCPPVGMFLPATGGAAVVDASSTKARRFYMADSTVTVAKPDARWTHGVLIGSDATLVRVEVRGTVDGFGWIDKAGGTVQPIQLDCVVEDLSWFAVDPLNPSHTDGTHNDAVQSGSPVGPGAKVLGGRYDCGPRGTAAFMLNVKSVNGLTISRVETAGGRCAFNLGPTPSASGVAFTYNRIGQPVACFATDAAKPGVLMRGNVRPSGAPADTITRS